MSACEGVLIVLCVIFYRFFFGITAFSKQLDSERGIQETLGEGGVTYNKVHVPLLTRWACTSAVSFMFADLCFWISVRLSFTCRAFSVKTVPGSRFRCVQRVFWLWTKTAKSRRRTAPRITVNLWKLYGASRRKWDSGHFLRAVGHLNAGMSRCFYRQGHNNNPVNFFFLYTSPSDVKLVSLWCCRNYIRQLALIDPNPGFPDCFVVFGVSWWTDTLREEGAGGPGLNGSGLFSWPVMSFGGRGGICAEYKIRLCSVSQVLLVELHPNLVSGALLRCVTVFIRLSGLLPPG